MLDVKKMFLEKEWKSTKSFDNNSRGTLECQCVILSDLYCLEILLVLIWDFIDSQSSKREFCEDPMDFCTALQASRRKPGWRFTAGWKSKMRLAVSWSCRTAKNWKFGKFRKFMKSLDNKSLGTLECHCMFLNDQESTDTLHVLKHELLV